MSDNIFKQTIPVLKTARLTLRPISLTDLEAMFNYASSENVARYVTWEPHKSLDATKEFVELILNGYEQKLIGTIDFVSINSTHKFAEIGYVLSEAYWNNGITTEAAKKLIDFGFNELGLVRIQARCFEENIGSQKVMEKSGMLFEGILRKSMFVKGNHQNVKMYAITDEDYANS